MSIGAGNGNKLDVEDPLRNPSFEDGLTGWEIVEHPDDAQKPGSVTAVSNGARLAVDGSPSTIFLEQRLKVGLSAGSTITIDFETGGALDCCGGVQIYLSKDEANPTTGEDARISHPEDGTHSLSLTAERDYEAGDFFRIRTSIWPGSGYNIVRQVAWNGGSSGGEFTVTINSTNDPVQETEKIDVNVTITNDGTNTDTQTINFEVEGVRTAFVKSELDSGESESVTFTWPTSEGDAGEHEIIIESEDDTATTTVVVETKDNAYFEVEINSTNAPIEETETLEVDATVTNTGDKTAKKTIVLSDYDTLHDRLSQELDSGQSTTVTLTWDTDEGDAGEHDIIVRSNDDGSSTSIVIEEQKSPSTGTSYDLKNADHSMRVVIDDEPYLILWGIPDAAYDRRAVVTPDYELVSQTMARDALIVGTWRDSQSETWTSMIETAEHNRKRWEILEIFSKYGEFSADVAAALAFLNVSPTASISHSLDALETSIQWTKETITDPHREQFSKMAEGGGTLKWCHEEFLDITSVTELSQSAIEAIKFTVNVYEAIDDIRDVIEVSQTAVEVAEQSDSIATGIQAGGHIAEAKLFKMLPVLAASKAVDGMTDLHEANARTAAAGAAHNTVRLPILRELRDLHADASMGIIDPPDIARYHFQKMVQYQIGAAGFGAMAAYQDGISNSLIGMVVSDIFGSDEIGDLAAETRDQFANLARHSIAELGAGWVRSKEQQKRSINVEVLDNGGGS